MKIRIPNIDDKESFIEDKQSIVLLGAKFKVPETMWSTKQSKIIN